MFVNQSIQRPNGVNVFGSCLIRTEPDHASLRFTVASVAEKPKDALGEARAAAKRTREVLSKHGVADRDVRSSRVVMLLAYEGYGDARKAIGYRAAMSFQVFLRDLARVEAVLVEVVGAGAREIESVSYKSSKLREIRAQAREGAVVAARAKADLYAGAVGLKAGRALHIEDVNPDQLARRSHTPDVDLGEHDESELSGADRPGSIVVAAAVMVCFALAD